MWKFLTTTLLAMGLWASAAGVHAQTCGLRDNGDGTMTDSGTGLEIKVCSVGHTWANGKCVGSNYFSWNEAVERFSRPDTGGQGPWRMITEQEAKQVAVKSQGCRGFNTPSWTFSPNVGNSGNVSTIIFSQGIVVSEPLSSIGTHSKGVTLVRAGQPSGNTAASSSSTAQRPAPAQNTQQTTAPVPPAPYNKPSRDRPDLMGYGCDVGQGSTVKNGCSEIINYVLCIVRHPDGRTTGPDTCQGGQIRPGILLPQDSRRVTFGEGSFDYLVAACKHPARPYNVRYIPGQGLSVSCGEF